MTPIIPCRTAYDPLLAGVARSKGRTVADPILAGAHPHAADWCLSLTRQAEHTAYHGNTPLNQHAAGANHVFH